MSEDKSVELLSKYEPLELVERLECLPKDILLREIDNFRVGERVKELELKMRVISNDLLLDVLGLVDPVSGKAVFSNETSRKAEVKKQLDCHSGHVCALKDCDDLKVVFVLEGFYLDYMKRLFRCGESRARLGSR